MTNQDPDFVEVALSELVASGDMIEQITIDEDGTQHKSYRLTEQGLESTRELIDRLATENEE